MLLPSSAHRIQYNENINILKFEFRGKWKAKNHPDIAVKIKKWNKFSFFIFIKEIIHTNCDANCEEMIKWSTTMELYVGRSKG